MSRRFRPPPVDTDRRPFARGPAPGAERGGRMFRAPPPGAQPPWGVRPPLHRPPPEHNWPPPHPPPPSDWAPRPQERSDWAPRPQERSDWAPRPQERSDWSAGPPAASRLSAAAEGALGVLSSCGLDAEDLSALAELPEDLLTLKSLPLLLKQIKGLKKDPAPPGFLPPGRAPTPHYDQSQALYAGPAPRPDLDQSRSSYRDPGPSKSDFPGGGSSFVVEYGHCTAARDARSSPERPRRSSPDFTPRGSKEFRSVEHSPILGAVTLSSLPLETEVRDFHGMSPPAFPYSCSLCDITVLSDFVWTQHVTSTLHADSQLALMQRFPTWDCRVSSFCKSDSKQPKEMAKKPAKKNKKEAAPSSKKSAKVVCVKFPPQSVDESCLRKLMAEFGEIVHVAMFPSLGFVELETPEQAHRLIEHYTKTPHRVKDQEMEFSLSTTFNFLQSSFVLNFQPVPFGKEGQSDLMTIIKRFGTPRFTMFIPTRMQAYVEMQNAADAHKMVEYYSDNPLKMNGVDIKVSFSQEFRTLERCVMARPYDEGELKKPEEEPSSSESKEARSRASTSPAKERSHSQGKSPGKSPARSVRSVSSERRRRERSSVSSDRSRPEPKLSPEAEAQPTEDPHTASGEDNDLEEMQVLGEHLDDEKMDGPPDLSSCITLDEVSDSEEAEAEADVEDEDENSPRVVYIGDLPLCRFSDIQFIKMVKQVYKPVRYYINRRFRMGLVEFKSGREAWNFVAKMQDYTFGGCVLDVFLSNKYNKLPWGRGVEYDESGQVLRHFKVGRSPTRERGNPFHAQMDPTRSAHKYPQIEISHTPLRFRERSRGKSGERTRNRSRDRGRSRDRSKDGSRDRGRSRDRSKDGSRDRGRSRDRSKDGSRDRGRSRDRSRGMSKGTSRDRSRDRSRDKSRGRSRSKSADKSRENNKLDTAERSKSPPPPEETGASERRVEEPVTAAAEDEEGWRVHKDTSDQEDVESATVQIVNVVSLKEQKQECEDVAESKDEVKKEQEEEEETGSEGGRTAKRKGEAEEELGPEKRLKQDSTMTGGGAAETGRPCKPVGTEFLLFYCDLCHVKISAEQEARVSHCSSREHYLRYQERICGAAET